MTATGYALGVTCYTQRCPLLTGKSNLFAFNTQCIHVSYTGILLPTDAQHSVIFCFVTSKYQNYAALSS